MAPSSSAAWSSRCSSLRTGSRREGSSLGSLASACAVSQHPAVPGIQAEPAPPEAAPQARVGMPSPLFTPGTRTHTPSAVSGEHRSPRSARRRAPSPLLAPFLDDAEAPRRGAWSSRVYSACSWHRSGYRSSRVMLRGTAKGQSRPDDRHRSAHRILRHAAPAHFHCSRVGETHEVLRRSFSSLRRMVLQRVKRGIEAKIKPMRSYAQTISPGRLGRHQQYGQDDL